MERAFCNVFYTQFAVFAVFSLLRCPPSAHLLHWTVSSSISRCSKVFLFADVGSSFDHSFVVDNFPAQQEMQTCSVFKVYKGF